MLSILLAAGVFVLGTALAYSFKRLRMPVLRFFQRQFARFSAFAQRQQTPPAYSFEQEDENRDDEESGHALSPPFVRWVARKRRASSKLGVAARSS